MKYGYSASTSSTEECMCRCPSLCYLLQAGYLITPGIFADAARRVDTVLFSANTISIFPGQDR